MPAGHGPPGYVWAASCDTKMHIQGEMQTVLYQNKLKHRDTLNTLKAEIAIYAERKKMTYRG